MQLLQGIIRRYMLKIGCYILDGFCGTGSTSHAAVLLGMRAFAFDEDHAMVQAAAYRVEQWRNQYTPSGEIEHNLKRKQPEDDDEDSDEEKEEALAAARLEKEMSQKRVKSLLESAGAGPDDDGAEGDDSPQATDADLERLALEELSSQPPNTAVAAVGTEAASDDIGPAHRELARVIHVGLRQKQTDPATATELSGPE